MKTVKVAQVKTFATAHVVIRTAQGRKVFDMDMPGCSITITTPPDAEIRVFDPVRDGR
jgi:hypothetical protein